MRRTDVDLARIAAALGAVAGLLRSTGMSAGTVEFKTGDDPVTATDRAIDDLLRRALPQAGEGWLSEETIDDRRRLSCSRVWVVDPLDGTREFVVGVPEWAVSIGLIEDAVPIAGGVFNPATGEIFLGAIGHGVTLNGKAVRPRAATTLAGALVLASRSEFNQRRWERFDGRGFAIRPTGSVAYKLALVASGRADATWSVVPKHEWDVAGGVALAHAAGCETCSLAGKPLAFNQPDPVFTGLAAYPLSLREEVRATIGITG